METTPGKLGPMSRRRLVLVLLAVLGAGVFLAGLELMITAVALPSIIVDMARRAGIAELEAWTQLRRASWIINGYLLVYVVTMPLAGRLADLWGVRRLFLAALVAFSAGSLLAGAAQSLDELIAARLVQALGGGALVPVATAAAAHLYGGHARPRALGAIGALTFLGMATGPFVGAALLRSVHAESALAAAGIGAGPLLDLLAPAWRWVFYVNVPIARDRAGLRLGGQRRLGHAPPDRPDRPPGRRGVQHRSRCRADRADPAGQPDRRSEPGSTDAGPDRDPGGGLRDRA